LVAVLKEHQPTTITKTPREDSNKQKSIGKGIERQTLLIELLLSGYPSSTLPPVSYSPRATK